MNKTSTAHHPDFDDIVRLYKERYGIDLSHMGMKWSRHPVYNDGRRSYELDDDEAGGSWVDDGTVRINPKMGPVMKRFGIDGMTQREFRRRLIAHELAHEVWFKQNRKKRVKKLLKEVLMKARKEKFTTAYLDTYPADTPKGKFDSELFAEYISDQLNKKAEDASDDETKKIVSKLIAAHWKRRHPWGLRMSSGKFLGNDFFHSRNISDFDDRLRRKLMEKGVVYTGDKAVRANRGICHDLASARLKMLLDAGVRANRLFVDYESPDNPGNVLSHSMAFFKDRNGRYHHANRHIDEPGKLGDYKDIDEALKDFIKDVIKSKEAKKGEPISIYDTTDVEMPEELPLGEYMRLSREKGRKVYEQGKDKR